MLFLYHPNIVAQQFDLGIQQLEASSRLSLLPSCSVTSWFMSKVLFYNTVNWAGKTMNKDIYKYLYITCSVWLLLVSSYFERAFVFFQNTHQKSLE